MPISFGIDGKWGYIDTSGKFVIQLREFGHVEDFHHGLAYVVTRDGRHGYIDKSGNYARTSTSLYNN